MEGEEIVLVNQGSQRTDRFNTDGQILSSTDRNGNMVLISSSHESGASVTYVYDASYNRLAHAARGPRRLRLRRAAAADPAQPLLPAEPAEVRCPCAGSWCGW